MGKIFFVVQQLNDILIFSINTLFYIRKNFDYMKNSLGIIILFFLKGEIIIQINKIKSLYYFVKEFSLLRFLCYLIDKSVIPSRDKIFRNYILKNSKDIKKYKKGSKQFERVYDVEKSKLSIQRFKGLGEMNPEELWNTTLNPETRNLLQVQYSKNVKKDQEIIHILMGNDVSLRKDFIVSNAINVLNLDI